MAYEEDFLENYEMTAFEEEMQKQLLIESLSDLDIRRNAKTFIEYWKDRGYEKGESQKFWLDLLESVLGVSKAKKHIVFEEKVKLDHTSFIDAYIPATHILIEQKGRDKDLRKAIKQSDGTLLTPFQQAKRYSAELPYSQRPRWIITCNFQEFLIYDMEKPNSEPESILLKDLAKEYYRLQFIVDVESENIRKETEISIKAGELVGLLYDSLLKQYNEKDEEELKSLNELCVRLVFCLYAEDSGLFGGKRAFHNYLQSFKAKDARRALVDLFKVLDTKIENRDKYLDEDLAKFPYVNGGLFANEEIIIPQLTQEILDIILHRASENFDWSEISPTIFGAVFESTLNPETRRSGGMHYTSIKNIHKVIDPLFLDGLKDELEKIKEVKVEKLKNQQLKAYRKKLSKLMFLDPACGSGNFLTETYIALRRLENIALQEEINSTKNVSDNQIIMDFDDIINVSISQFYGIEINDFAVTVAKTALWISESQMMKETEMIVNRQLEFFPLKSYANIVEGNALRIDWNEVVPKGKLSYIMGNPPFIGQQLRNAAQTLDMENVFDDNEQAGHLDYVACWYKMACDYIINTKIEVAFVSTNSICQGEQVPILWQYLMNKYGIEINFAHKTFIWENEAKNRAAVHCIIVGFSQSKTNRNKIIYENGRMNVVKQINGYLIDAPMVFLESRTNIPQKGLPKLIKGSQPTDDGNLLLTKQEVDEILKKDKSAMKFIKPFMGAREFLNSTEQEKYCIWLKNISPNEFLKNSEIVNRLKKVKEFRLLSKNTQTREAANTPYLFTQIRQPENDYIMIPRVSSENRKYIPMAYLSKDIIAGDTTTVLPNADLYIFGVLESNVHMAWTRVVCGRLKSDYRYSPAIYNNFPWPNPKEEQIEKVKVTAKAILDARLLYPNCTLAELYNEIAMPPELRKAHQLNDKAVMEAYGFWGKINSESECVAELMKMYQKLTSNDN